MSPSDYYALILLWFLIGCLVTSRGLADPILFRKQDEFITYFVSTFLVIPLWPIYMIIRFFSK